jgi:hypothetical protein
MCQSVAKTSLLKIVSGGQTGVDRAALDVALQRGIECGGWCPAGRLDELGIIPKLYPVKELENGGFKDRTRRNVKDSDGTVIIYFDELRGGSDQTAQFCVEQKRPHELINAARIPAEQAGKRIADFVRVNQIATLNVAGPRQSDWPEGYDYVFRALKISLGLL